MSDICRELTSKELKPYLLMNRTGESVEVSDFDEYPSWVYQGIRKLFDLETILKVAYNEVHEHIILIEFDGIAVTEWHFSFSNESIDERETNIMKIVNWEIGTIL